MLHRGSNVLGQKYMILLGVFQVRNWELLWGVLVKMRETNISLWVYTKH